MKIPSRIRIKSRWVEVLFQEGFVSGKDLGLWEPNARHIVIADNQSEDKTLEIFIHEWLHAFSDLSGIALTEKQVEALDAPLMKLFKLLNEETKKP